MKFVLPIIILFVFISCDKDKPLSKTELLCKSSWMYKDAIKNGSSFISTISPCATDNIYTFEMNGIYSSDEGNSKCSPTDDQVETFDWFFYSNEDSISMNGLWTKVISLTDNEFITELTNAANDKFVYKLGK